MVLFLSKTIFFPWSFCGKKKKKPSLVYFSHHPKSFIISMHTSQNPSRLFLYFTNKSQVIRKFLDLTWAIQHLKHTHFPLNTVHFNLLTSLSSLQLVLISSQLQSIQMLNKYIFFPPKYKNCLFYTKTNIIIKN